MLLGQFQLSGLPPAPRGVPQIEVTFDIDANGILNVSAKDKASGKEQKITITASTNLSEKEVDRMVREADQNRTADEKRAELVKVKNEADSLAYQVEKSVKDLGDKVNATDRGMIERQITDLREAAKTDDVNRIRTATEALQGAAHTLSEQAYAQQGQPTAGSSSDFGGYGDYGANGSGGNRQQPDDVVEGQFTEI